MTIELTEDDMQQLTTMCGYAVTMALTHQKDRTLARTFVDLTNRIHKDREGWVPYQLNTLSKLRESE